MLWGRPATSHADDIEFDVDDAIPSPWTTWNTIDDATAIDPYASVASSARLEINTRRPSHLSLQAAGDSVNYGIHRAYTFPTNLLVWARIVVQSHQSTTIADNDFTYGLIVGKTNAGNPTFTDAVRVEVNESDTNTQQASFIVHRGNVVVTNLTLASATSAVHNVSYAAIHKIGTTVHGWVAGSAGDWVWLGSSVFTGTLDRVTIRAQNASTTSPGSKIAHFDFVRFVESATYLP